VPASSYVLATDVSVAFASGEYALEMALYTPDFQGYLGHSSKVATANRWLNCLHQMRALRKRVVSTPSGTS
jgi:hypothetical protein